MTQTVPDFSDCAWPIDPACLGSDWTDLPPEVQDRATALASSTLRRLTAYRVGGCPITVRPVRQSCCVVTLSPNYWELRSGMWGAGGFFPQNLNGTWINSCGCTTACTCAPTCDIVLPPPIGRVDEVKVDGQPVADYVTYRDRIVWAGTGDCPWPFCQDLTLPDTEVGTMSVTYLNSYPVDGLGAYAAGVLAYEYAQACQGNHCRLPTNVTQVTRQGVSMTIDSGAFPSGMTGIREVDAFIALWNPNGRRQVTGVWAPGLGAPPVVR